MKKTIWQAAVLLLILCCCLSPVRAENWALLIGIDDYENSLDVASLAAAGNDAQGVANALIEVAGYPKANVIVLTSKGVKKPLKKNILRELETLSTRIKPGDTVFVLYAGHGMEVEGVPYLLPYDVDIATPNLIKDTAIPVEKFREYLKKLPADALILAFDMCRVNPDKTGRGAAGDNPLTTSMTRGLDLGVTAGNDGPPTARTGPKIVVSFFACSPEQKSYEWRAKGRGYFSYFLEQGLRGQAANNGKVTVEDLKQYLGTAVPEAVRREELGKDQTPTGEVKGPLDAGNFALVKNAGGGNKPKPAPVKLRTEATMFVKSNVPDATITVAGTKITDGVYQTDLGGESSREVKVVVTADGYMSDSQIVTLQPGEYVHEVTLTKKTVSTPPVTPDKPKPTPTQPDSGGPVVGKVTPRFKMKGGTFAREAVDLEVTGDYQGHKITLQVNRTIKRSFAESSGNIRITTKTEKADLKLFLDGKETPQDPQAAQDLIDNSEEVVTIDPLGRIVGDMKDDDPQKIDLRTTLASSPILPDDAVEVGESWTESYPDNVRHQVPPATATFTLEAKERKSGFDCWRIKSEYAESTLLGDGIVCKGTVWIECATGEPVAYSLNYRNLPMTLDADGNLMICNGTAKMTRK